MGKSYVIAEDPRGFAVDFSDTRWNWITQKHPDLINFGISEKDIKKAIEHPLDDTIYKSEKYADCCLYYHKVKSGLLIRVVVKYDPNNIGEIPTAHLFSSESPRGSVLWQKPK